MTRSDFEAGFALGRTLTQEEWASPDEIQAVDELVSEGRAIVVSGWKYLDGFQCERRRVMGVRSHAG